MDWSMAALLAGAGTLGGAINALAGGATLITFPAMVAAGLPPVIANASSAVAISPGHILPRWPTAKTCPRPIAASGCWPWRRRRAARWAPSSCWRSRRPISSCRCRRSLPRTLLFAFCRRKPGASARRRGAQAQDSRARRRTNRAGIGVWGFFGAGLGVILTAVISITDPGNLRAIKSLKNLLATFVTAAAIVIFIAQDRSTGPPPSACWRARCWADTWAAT